MESTIFFCRIRHKPPIIYQFELVALEARTQFPLLLTNSIVFVPTMIQSLWCINPLCHSVYTCSTISRQSGPNDLFRRSRHFHDSGWFQQHQGSDMLRKFAGIHGSNDASKRMSHQIDHSSACPLTHLNVQPLSKLL
jgi:hypothetical protein